MAWELESNIVILGVDEPAGRAWLEDCLKEPKKHIVGISFYSPETIDENLIKSLKDLKAIAVLKGTYDNAPEGVSVFIGPDGPAKMSKRLESQETALCIYGKDSYRVFQELSKDTATILLGESDTVLVGNLDVTAKNGRQMLSRGILEGIELAKLAEEKDEIEIFYTDDQIVSKSKVSELFKKTGKDLSEPGIDPRGTLESVLFLRAYSDLAILSRLTRLPISTFHAAIDPEMRYSALLKKPDGSLFCISRDEDGNIVPELHPVEESLELKAPSYELYPMFHFLVKLSGKFGWRGDIAIRAASEAAITVCAEGRIDLSSAETVIRQVASSACRSLKTPKSSSEAWEQFDAVYKEALSLSDRIANAREHGNTASDVKKSKELNRARDRKNKESEKVRLEKKKASRWKNDPEKKELWEEHQRVKEIRNKRKAENERRASRRVHQTENARKDRNIFPVVVVDDERRDREEHLKRREHTYSRPYRSNDRKDSYSSKRSDRPYRDRDDRKDKRPYRSKSGDFKDREKRPYKGHSSDRPYRTFHGPKKNDSFAKDSRKPDRKSYRKDDNGFKKSSKPYRSDRPKGDHRPSRGNRSYRSSRSEDRRESHRSGDKRRYSTRRDGER